MIKQLAFLLLIIFIFAGCKARTVSCTNTSMTTYFIGYRAADIDTLVFKQYQVNDSFHHLIDTFTVFTSANASHGYIYTSHDTTSVDIGVVSGQYKNVMPGYDWQIFIPALNKTIAVTNIVSPQTEQTCYRCVCTNPITSLELDGQTAAPVIGTTLLQASGNVVFGFFIRK